MEVAQARDKYLKYIEGVLVGGMTKRDAYATFVDSTVKNIGSAVARLEKKKEYQDLYRVVTTDENYKFQASAQRVRSKYLGLIEKNIDTAGDLLDDARRGEPKDKAMAVRLTNETIQAMAIVASPVPQAGDNNSINKAGVIS